MEVTTVFSFSSKIMALKIEEESEISEQRKCYGFQREIAHKIWWK